MSARLLRYLRRPDVRRNPVKLVARRALIEIERRLSPGRYAAERMVTLPNGLRMSVRATDQIERAIYLFGLYEFASANAFAKLVAPGSTVVDAGAHSGQYTLLAASRAGLVVAAEPHPGLRERLERNVAMNGLKNVRVVPHALSDTTGRVTMAVPEGENTGIASMRAATATERQIEVDADTLDAILDRSGTERLDVVKLDVEGAEARVLSGGHRWITRHKPAILFEANELYFGGERSKETVGALRNLGYRLYEPSRLSPLEPDEDVRSHREYWMSLNLIALHPDRANEFGAG